VYVSYVGDMKTAWLEDMKERERFEIQEWILE
jgi:hypothetical protein